MALRNRDTWNALSPRYKQRLARHGITEQRYLTGEPLTGARGHARTPEHPGRATPAKYPEYVSKRTGVPVHVPTNAELERHFRETLIQGFIAGDIERIDVTHLQEYLPLLNTQQRIEMMGTDLESWRDKARIQQPKGRKTPARKWFVRVGDHWENPFWYH